MHYVMLMQICHSVHHLTNDRGSNTFICHHLMVHPAITQLDLLQPIQYIRGKFPTSIGMEKMSDDKQRQQNEYLIPTQ